MNHTACATIDTNKCIACSCCYHHCPTRAIKTHKTYFVQVEPSLCIGCKKCIEVCPTSCITMIPK